MKKQSPQWLVQATAALAAATALGLLVLPAACTRPKHGEKSTCFWALQHPNTFDVPHARQLHSLSQAGRAILPIATSAALTVTKLNLHGTSYCAPATSALLIAASALCGLTISTHTMVVDEANVVDQKVANTTGFVLCLIGTVAAGFAAQIASKGHVQSKD